MKQSIATRLALVVSVGIALVLGLTGWMLTLTVDNNVRQLSDQDLRHLASSAAIAAKAYSDELDAEAKRLSGVFLMSFPGQFSLDTSQQETVAGQSVPVLKLGDQPVSASNQLVDAFFTATGGNATLFVRRGQDFVRLITSVKKQDGSRAVGTLLDHKSPAYQALMQGDAYTGKATLFGRDYITNYSPLKDAQGNVIGIRYIGIDFSASLKNLENNLNAEHIGKRGFLFAVSTEAGDKYGRFAIHPLLSGQNISNTSAGAFIGDMIQRQSGSFVFAWPTGNNLEGPAEPWVAQLVPVPAFNWVLAAAIPQSEIEATSLWVEEMQVASTIGILLVVCLILWVASRHFVSKPLEHAIAAMEVIAKGDYSREIKVTSSDETGRLLSALRDMQTRVRSAVQEITSIASNLSQAAAQLSAASTQVASGSSEQSQAATLMASTIEELTVSIDRLSENAEEAQRLSKSSYQTSSDGAQVIDRASAEMQKITQTVRTSADNISALGALSEQVSSIIQVIENIAGQTNLLALNAAIEAARAGEQGRGFAVVADEVRNLAARTTDSAQEITATIKQIQEGTHKAVESMNLGVHQVASGASLAGEAGSAIRDIKDSSARVVDVFSEISLMLKEQSQASQDVAKNVDNIASMTQTNNQAVQEVASAAQELKQMAESLNQLVRHFRT